MPPWLVSLCTVCLRPGVPEADLALSLEATAGVEAESCGDFRTPALSWSVALGVDWALGGFLASFWALAVFLAM